MLKAPNNINTKDIQKINKNLSDNLLPLEPCGINNYLLNLKMEKSEKSKRPKSIDNHLKPFKCNKIPIFSLEEEMKKSSKKSSKISEDNYINKANKSLKNSEKISEKNSEKNFFFAFEFLKEINKARINPQKYSEGVIRMSMDIRTNYSTAENFIFFGNKKIKMDKSPLALYNFSDYLKNKKILPKIFFEDQLKIPFPQEIKIWNSDKYLKESIKNLRRKVKGKFKLKKFLSKKILKITNGPKEFKYFEDGKISAILALLDESEICEFFLDEEIKYIGMNLIDYDDKNILAYFSLAA